MKQFFLSRYFIRTVAAILLLAAVGLESMQAVKATGSTSISTPSVTVTVNPDGAYTIVSKTPAWTFGGTIGHSLTNIKMQSGSDHIGSYQEIVCNYQDGNKSSRGAGIRAYNAKPIVLFTDSYLSATPNNSPFPRLSTYPATPYHLSYSGIFAQATFSNFGFDSPWLFFDAHENTFVLSPASDFMVATTAKARDGSISSGITPVINTLPAGFAHKTFLVIGQGFSKVEQMWGRAMTDLQGKVRPANDANPTLDKLGYWTDHGATY